MAGSVSGIAQNWRELSGENNWEGLLEPLDIDLRRCIIHYGERVGAVGRAFIREKGSKWYGFSRYPPKDLFSNVGLERGNTYKYTVTNFFYANATSILGDIEKQSSWIGYVAVATDEGKVVLGRRDILITWRGALTTLENCDNMDWTLSPASDLFGDHDPIPKVHKGFLSLYTSTNPDSDYNQISAGEQVLREVRKLVDKYQDEEISITVAGHSMGAALATLNAMEIVVKGSNKPSNGTDKACPVTAIVFGSPRVGDESLKKIYSTLDELHILRIANIKDVVIYLPPKDDNHDYVHVGEELKIDSSKSPDLKSLQANLLSAHMLEVYLHTVAGTQGIDGGFELVVPRSISLVNSETNALKDEYKVPDIWWIEKNKSMVQHDDGTWDLDDHGYAPLPST